MLQGCFLNNAGAISQIIEQSRKLRWNTIEGSLENAFSQNNLYAVYKYSDQDTVYIVNDQLIVTYLLAHSANLIALSDGELNTSNAGRAHGSTSADRQKFHVKDTKRFYW